MADDALDDMLSPIAGEVVANNRFSTDAFVVAGDLEHALDALAGCETDNAAARHLNEAGFAWRDLGASPWTRFDVDTTLDLALLRLATRLPGTRPLDGSLRGFLEMARLPGDRSLEVPHLERIGEVIRDRSAELVVAGRVPLSTWQELETRDRVPRPLSGRGARHALRARPGQPSAIHPGRPHGAVLAGGPDRGAGAAGRCRRPRHAGAHGVRGRLVRRVGLASR